MSNEGEVSAPEALLYDDPRARIGTVLRGKWRLDALIGVGGSAAVYAASHRNNGARAAVKILHAELGRRVDLVSRFIKEGYFANRIAHRCTVAVLDDDRAEDGAVYMVMELLEGESLERWVEGPERLSFLEVIRVADEVLDLLAAAHAAGVIHRDIKPGNIFLTRQGGVKVLDFGIARFAEAPAGPMSTQLGTQIGTPTFMPPEQARGRWNLVDGRSDVFGVGATLFALLTGKKPREAETGNEELLLAMTTPVRPVAELQPEIPFVLADVVDRALAFEMSARWPDARSMQAALRVARAALEEGGPATIAIPRVLDAAAGQPLGRPAAKTLVEEVLTVDGGLEDGRPDVAPCYVHGALTPVPPPPSSSRTDVTTAITAQIAVDPEPVASPPETVAPAVSSAELTSPMVSVPDGLAMDAPPAAASHVPPPPPMRAALERTTPSPGHGAPERTSPSPMRAALERTTPSPVHGTPDGSAAPAPRGASPSQAPPPAPGSSSSQVPPPPPARGSSPPQAPPERAAASAPAAPPAASSVAAAPVRAGRPVAPPPFIRTPAGPSPVPPGLQKDMSPVPPPPPRRPDASPVPPPPRQDVSPVPPPPPRADASPVPAPPFAAGSPAPAARRPVPLDQVRAAVPSAPPFSAMASALTVTYDPQFGPLLVGVHAPPDQPPRLRCYSLQQQAIAWQALKGEGRLGEVCDLVILGREVFLGHRADLDAFDLVTGAQIWSSRLPDKIDVPLDGAYLVEAGGGALPPVLVVRTTSGAAVSIDRATGQERARRNLGGGLEASAIEGGQAVVLRYRVKDRYLLEVVNPITLEPIGSMGKSLFGDGSSFLEARVEGTFIVARVEQWGLLSAKGILVLDAATQREVLFLRESNIDPEVSLTFGRGTVCWASSGRSPMIHAAPGGKRAPLPLAGHRVVAMKHVGAALLVALEDMAQPGITRLAVCDPQTLTPRFQGVTLASPGSASRHGRRDATRYALVNGHILFVAVIREDGAGSELRAIDGTTGGVLWRLSLHDVGPIDFWHMSGPALIVKSHAVIQVVDPGRGVAVARYVAG